MSIEPDATPDGIPRPDPSAVAVAPVTTGRRGRRAGRVSRWDRVKPPKDWRYWVGGTGRILMTTGILMFGFVAYQLWGTGIEYRQNQNSLEREFERRIEALDTGTTVASNTTVPAATARPATTEPSATTGPPTSTGGAVTSGPSTSTTVAGGSSGAPVTTVTPAVWPSVTLGDVLAYIEIPKLGKTVYAVAGIRTEDLKKGLGHYPDTPLPGQFGNSAFAGHRTTYGAPLFDIDQLVAGDEIVVNTLTHQRYVYRMVGESKIVDPEAYGVITDSDPTKATLTITSCHPRYSAKKRIVVRAELDVPVSGPIQFATPYYGQTVDPAAADRGDPTDDDVVVEPDDSVVVQPGDSVPDPVAVQIDAVQYDGAEALSRGWFHDSAAWPQVALWGAVLILIGVGAYLLNRRLKRYWPGIVVAVAPVVVTLYFFYQNINRLLPPDL